MSNTKAPSVSPFALTISTAITRLQESGNWPRPSRMTREEAASDYYVNAAFWGWPEALDHYLSGAVTG